MAHVTQPQIRHVLQGTLTGFEKYTVNRVMSCDLGLVMSQ